MMPPSILRIRIVDQGKKRINIWFPLFIFWPFIALLIVLLFPVFILVCVVMKIAWNRTWLFYAAPVCIEMLFAMKGLNVRIQNPMKNLFVLVHID